MTIETNHSVSDVVWTIYENKAMELIVDALGVDAFSDNINYPISDSIYYILRSANKLYQNIRRSEGQLFKSKEALLQSL